MRNPSRMMIGLLLGAVMVSPIAAQAQERGRWRGDNGSGQRAAAMPRSGGIDRSAVARSADMNGDARRAAIAQAREAQRAVERPAPAPTLRSDGGDSRRQWQGVDRNRNDERRSGDWERRREAVAGGAGTGAQVTRGWDRNRDGAGNRERRDERRWDRDGDRTANRGDRDRNWDGNRDGRDRNWDRDRDGRNDGNRRWTTDRRDWNGRDWDRRDNDRWDRNWRNDRRYGWQDYRRHNRHIYRLPRYQARYGYSYRRWYPGYRFDPFFYSSSYWISDPFYYRLPPAYGPYRWVRYFDDVALVDTRNGEIIDIIYSFFL